MDVLFVTAGDRTQASSRLRVYELIPHLKQAGISPKTIAVPRLEDGLSKIYKKSTFASRVIYNAIKSDVVYIQKVRLPVWFTKLLSNISSNLIYDFDDAIYRSPVGGEINKQTVQQLRASIKYSDLVIAGSRDLLEYAKRYNDNVECLHTGIPEHKYSKYCNSPESDSESILLGWIGNPENLYYLNDIEEQLNQVLDSHDNIQLRIITGKNTPVRPLKHREQRDVEYIEWDLESAISDLAKADLGLRPLRNNSWTRSKGGFTSVIECLALGIPVVASPVGLIKYMIEDGKNGYLADNDNEWIRVLSMIARKPRNTIPMKQRAIETVSKYEFWSEDTADTLTRLLYTTVK